MFERFNRRSATITATALIATMGLGGAAIAKSGGAKHPTKAVVVQSQTSSENTSGPDTDNVQSGDQNAPDAVGAAAEKTSGPDTDSVQSGDQNAPDAADAADAAGEQADTETAAGSDGPGGHADEPGNANANHEAQGAE